VIISLVPRPKQPQHGSLAVSSIKHHICEHLWGHFLTHFDPNMVVLFIMSALVHHVTYLTYYIYISLSPRLHQHSV